MIELPTMSTSTYASTNPQIGRWNANDFQANLEAQKRQAIGPMDEAIRRIQADHMNVAKQNFMNAARQNSAAYEEDVKLSGLGLIKEKQMAARIVRVYIADTDPNLPLSKQLLYTGDEKLTDSTDQELFYEIPIQSILSEHNAYRATMNDKKASEKFGKEVKLEPIRIRDLKMSVVVIASF